MVISEMKGRSSWKKGSGIAPELTAPQPGKWEKVKIKIPSAINVNDWGRGSKVGAGTPRPYTPSSVYFPSYPEHWVYTRMGWHRISLLPPVMPSPGLIRQRESSGAGRPSQRFE